MLHDLPALPESGPIRHIAIAGTIALVAFLASGVASGLRRDWRELRWSVALVALGIVAGLAGHVDGGWHVVLTSLVASIALRNVACAAGAARWMIVAGLLAWSAAVVGAYRLFH